MRENSSEETASARSCRAPGASALPSAPDLPTLFPKMPDRAPSIKPQATAWESSQRPALKGQLLWKNLRGLP